VNITTDIGLANLYGGGLGYMINETRNAIFAAIEKELVPLNITSSQFIVVVGIAHKRAKTLTEFSKLLGYDTGAMTRLLDRIEQKDIIKRVRSTTDRRTINIELTPKGEELYPQIMAIVTRVHEKLLDGFSGDDAAQFHLLLKRALVNATK